MVAKNTPKAIKQPSSSQSSSHASEFQRGSEEDDLSIEYPSSDGEPMAESELQFVPLTDTVITLKNWFAHRSDVYVAGDMLVYYRINDNRTRLAPDVFAVFGAAGNHPRDSWLIWREGKAPDFVMEIASPGTWVRDANEKREIYARMGVTEYWRFDPTGECFTPPLVGETLSEGQYQRLLMESDSTSVLWGHSSVLGLDICAFSDLELRLYDPSEREWLLTPRESEVARLEAARGMQASEAARLEAERGMQASEAARLEAERGMQASEAARLEAERERQSSEAARLALAAENESLREQLRTLQSGS